MQAETELKTVTNDIFNKCHTFTSADEVREQNFYPFFHPISSELGDNVIIDGAAKIMIGSNNYLGLVNDPRVKEAAANAALKYGSGCTGSRFLNGTIDLHIELESRLAQFMGKQAALVFSTGFQANLGTISSLAGKSDTLVLDRQDHACIVDGARLSHGRVLKFKHNDMNDLERILIMLNGGTRRGGILIIADGVFSMEGDIVDLPRLTTLAKKYGARVFVDDAHAIGIIGKNGSGTASHFDLVDQVDITSGTFSKSFASLGGFIAADNDVIDYVKHLGRSLIFSASIPPSNAAAALAALNIMETEPERRENLWRITHRMHRELRSLGFDIGDTETPVVPILVGEDTKTFKFWKMLFDEGVFANAIISPATPPGRALIRTSYTATMSDETLDIVLEKLQKVGKALDVI
ncbi:pyridoxal phosphate-dependent aminotransferase family protein [Gemmatimonas aurantiaca]|nr:pyridoxal phosphate-dependent aminotransferase family protein [Gemmatimonas aurantiaca]